MMSRRISSARRAGPVVEPGFRYWVGAIDSFWNKAGNWASSSGGAGGAGVPTASDAVIFDNQYTIANCTLDVAASMASIDVQSTYNGILDFADSAYAHSIAGDATFDGSGTVDCGDATITVSGNFDNRDQTTWTLSLHTIILSGASKTLSLKNTYLFNITISGSYTSSYGLTVANDIEVSGTLVSAVGVTLASGDILVTSTGTLTINGNSSLLNNCNIEVQAGGTLNGSGEVQLKGSDSVKGVITSNVSIRPTSTKTITLYDSTFNGYLITTAATAGHTIDCNSNNPNLSFSDDVDIGTNTTWTPGTGMITIAGTAAQSIDFSGESVEDIEISNTAATVTFSGNVTTDSLTQDAGSDVAGAVTITVTPGNFVINGASGNECTWNGPDLNVAGTAVAHYTTVQDSDASVGTPVDATDNCVNGGNNPGWLFN